MPSNLSRQVGNRMGESNKSKMQHMKKAQFPTDLGLFPKTFVAAPWPEYLPLIRSNTKLWLRIQWLLIKKPVAGLAS